MRSSSVRACNEALNNADAALATIAQRTHTQHTRAHKKWFRFLSGVGARARTRLLIDGGLCSDAACGGACALVRVGAVNDRFDRMNFLYQAAELVQSTANAGPLAQSYVGIMRKLAAKSVLRMSVNRRRPRRRSSADARAQLEERQEDLLQAVLGADGARAEPRPRARCVPHRCAWPPGRRRRRRRL